MDQDVNPQQRPRPPKPGQRTRRAPRKVTNDRLKRQALYYLERYNANRASLVQVLKRKVSRAAREHPDTDIAQAHEWINEIADECVRIGLVNDAAFALTRARSLLRSGKSLRAVSTALRQKGVGDDDIKAAMERLTEELTDNEDQRDLDLEAAKAYARKRRLGGLRHPIDHDRYDKDLAALARRGFSFDLAKQVLDETFEGNDQLQ